MSLQCRAGQKRRGYFPNVSLSPRSRRDARIKTDFKSYVSGDFTRPASRIRVLAEAEINPRVTGI